MKEEWNKIAKFLDVPLEEIYEEDEAKIIVNNENHASGENSGMCSTYYNIPDFMIENLQDYITILKNENQKLKEEIKSLKNR